MAAIWIALNESSCSDAHDTFIENDALFVICYDAEHTSLNKKMACVPKRIRRF